METNNGFLWFGTGQKKKTGLNLQGKINSLFMQYSDRKA